jgi:hypothetical protein
MSGEYARIRKEKEIEEALHWLEIERSIEDVQRVTNSLVEHKQHRLQNKRSRDTV